MPLPRSIASIRREIAEKKWEEARNWSEKRIKKRKYKLSEKMRQNAAVARGPKRLAERFHQLRTGHCHTGQYLEWTGTRARRHAGGVSTRYKHEGPDSLFMMLSASLKIQ